MKIVFLFLLLFIIASCSIEESQDSVTTYIDSNGDNIAIKINFPETPRYSDGAPIIIDTPSFFTPEKPTLNSNLKEITNYGFIEIILLWPGLESSLGSSEGTYDYGGEDSIQAFSRVIKFASGEIPDINGNYISNYANVAKDNLGLYAFSHQGIAATNVLALYPDLNVQYFVGRENPTTDVLYPLELGYFNDEKKAVLNPTYDYPDDYSSKEINLDYSTIYWDEDLQTPFLDSNNNQQLDSNEFQFGTKIPTMFNKKFYSQDLTKALKDNLEASNKAWPEGIATYEETNQYWPFRTTINNYNKINSKIKVLLLFSKKDHVQATSDKPHIHQAYDGFASNGNWIRLSPDSSYAKYIGFTSSIDNDANTEPNDWSEIEDWSEPSEAALILPYASICEMADRTYYNNWDDNLNSVLT